MREQAISRLEFPEAFEIPVVPGEGEREWMLNKQTKQQFVGKPAVPKNSVEPETVPAG